MNGCVSTAEANNARGGGGGSSASFRVIAMSKRQVALGTSMGKTYILQQIGSLGNTRPARLHFKIARSYLQQKKVLNTAQGNSGNIL